MRSGFQDDTDGYLGEDVEMLMKDEWIEKLFDCNCISSIAVNFKRCRRMTVMVTHVPYNDREEEVKDTIEKELERVDEDGSNVFSEDGWM